MNKLDEHFLNQTFRLARKGEGIVSPNPLVGACVVKDGVIIGKGYHKGPGTPHAEVAAINQAGHEAEGATIYVSLEPCCHHGKTPPCVELIEAKGIKRVVAPIKDPNPLVDGKGFEYLRNKNIRVETGVLEEEARKLNSFYLKYITEKKPYVILKAAVTLDGKIGDPDRGIFKISGDESHKKVYRLRNKVDAILVGVGTILIDNPALTVREIKVKKQPYKIIIDPYLKCPVDAKIFREGGKVILVTTKEKAKHKYKDSIVWVFKEKDGLINVNDILEKAGEENINSIMIEGGSETFTRFVETGVVDKYVFFISTSFLGSGVPIFNSAFKRVYLNADLEKIGEDFLVEATNVYGNN
jgi:diaminohydroxyphosphoribosylaminopyrimidine deaminase/5-amino-6-(5-phosphoribosylamino)uracil reductase